MKSLIASVIDSSYITENDLVNMIIDMDKNTNPYNEATVVYQARSSINKFTRNLETTCQMHMVLDKFNSGLRNDHICTELLTYIKKRVSPAYSVNANELVTLVVEQLKLNHLDKII